MIHAAVALRKLTRANVATIRRWPSYPKELRALDYALRSGGWLDTYAESETTRRFGAWEGRRLVGFSILTDITPRAAEFYIAVHPKHIGRGIGWQLTTAIMAYAFTELKLRRLYLKVRVWHKRAIALYERVGFVKKGRKLETIRGKPVHFLIMEINGRLRADRSNEVASIRPF
jgi:RimJ/RimL family protein N-acetyltransferase